MSQISIKNDFKLNLGVIIQKYQIFGVQIGSAKMTRKVQSHPEASLIKYHQKISNSCFLSSLAADFHCIGDNRAVSDIVNRIKESMTLQTKKFNNRIHFDYAIMKNIRKIKGEHNLIYNLTIRKKHDAFDIINDYQST